MSAASDHRESDTLVFSAEEAIYKKIIWRFIPLLFTAYVFNYMDRTNIGFAQLQMKGDLGLSDIAYGFGASIFFLSYAGFALPSNMIMSKIGARKTILGCLVGWGLISASMMFVRTAHQFYIVRFSLGVVEAGFVPGVLFYFGKWLPSHRRANVTGLFMSATVMAGVVSGLISGALMTWLNGLLGLHGWQWMFVIEGLPSVLLGIIIFFYLDNEPEEANWLSPTEKQILQSALARDPVMREGRHTLGQAFTDWRVYLLGVIYFFTVIDTYVLAFWQPQMIKEFGVSSILRISLYTTIPAVAAVIAKVWIGYRSDKKHELRWHFAVPALLGAMGLSLTTLFPHNWLLGLAFLTLATAGVHGCAPVFWAVPGLYLTGSAAAGGLAIINTISTTAGAVGPSMLGEIKALTGSFDYGMYLQSAVLVVAVLLMFVAVSKKKQASFKSAAIVAPVTPTPASENLPG